MSSDDTPITRLRASHARRDQESGTSYCQDCEEHWPCDVVAALDALEAERDEADEMAVDAVSLAARHGAALNALRARLDAATVLLRRGVFDTPDLHRVLAWLAGDKEAE